MYTHNNKVLQNLYFLPFLMVFFQFVFLFISLIFSGYFFEWKILFSAFFIVCVWGSLFLISALKNKNINFNIQNIILFIIFSICCLCLIRFSWFSHYLRIDAVKRFFEGKTFIDTLYHSAIAESIVTNGYPSTQQNAPIFLAYHCLSHYLIAGVARIFNLPCFVIYNYFFPVFVIPLLLFFLQKVASIGKDFFYNDSSLYFSDYIILIGFTLGFFTKRLQGDMGCNLNVNIYNSESCLIAIIILLLFFYIANKGYRNIKGFDNINLSILIPTIIILLSYSKISFGLIFASGAIYYVFRKYFLKSKKSLFAIVYLFVFVLYYLAIKKVSISYHASDRVALNSFKLFDYPLTYCTNSLFMVLHYLFLFFPIIAVIYKQRKVVFKNIFTFKRECIFSEMCFFLMIGACLPGVLLVIHGGSAFYFVVPVYIFSWLLFVSSGAMDIFSCSRFVIDNNGIILLKETTFTMIIFVLILSTGYKEVHLENSIIQTIRSRIALTGFKKDISGKIRELFMPVKNIGDQEYILFNQIRNDISQASEDYCIFLSDDSDLIRKFDYYLGLTKHPRIYLCRPYFAVSAYIGIPVINSVYEKDRVFYRGDDRIFGTYGDMGAYSMPPALCKGKVSEDTMIERAKEIGKKHIIVLNKCSYSIIDVK